MSRRLVPLLAALLVLAGCFGGGGGEAPEPTPVPTVSDPPAPRPAPRAGACHDLAFAAASRPTGGGKEVRCSRDHTSITIHVGTDRLVLDGHLLAVDSRQVQAQLAAQCPRHLASYLAADTRRLRLSEFETVWFGPSIRQAGRGARWYRCDVVAVARDHRFAELPADLRGALSSDDDLDEWGICGTASPSARGFEEVICSEPHRWRAIDVVDLSGDVRYLGRFATRRGNDACKAAASADAEGSLEYSWSFQWPTREQWDAGQRYGLCWVPDE